MGNHSLYFGSILVVMSSILFIAVVIKIMNFKKYAEQRDTYNNKRLDNLETILIDNFNEILKSIKN